LRISLLHDNLREVGGWCPKSTDVPCGLSEKFHNTKRLETARTPRQSAGRFRFAQRVGVTEFRQ
jgi:hypothetical protein